jgi:predicted alpha/beta-hydrolase family hydrolase
MDLLITESNCAQPIATLILAHGAGAPMDSEFMERVTALYSERGVRVVRFEFPYMEERRASGKKRPPDRAPKLLARWQEVVDSVLLTSDSVFIGGKSMGGRMATLLMAEHQLAIKGCICFGYPYHAPGKQDKVRNDHFSALTQPVLVMQGERDAFGTKEEVEAYAKFEMVNHHWLTDGNHDLKPRKASGVTHDQNIIEAVECSVNWIKTLVE